MEAFADESSILSTSTMEDELDRVEGKFPLYPETDKCTPWPQNRHSNHEGYGLFQFRVGGKKRKVRAHRAAFYYANGTLPGVVRHSCDNPACINPRHLLGGSHADNVSDRVSRERSAIGETNGRAKLTWEKVAAIRSCSSSTSHKELAELYGVDRKTIRLVRAFKTWIPRKKPSA